ncbi:MAG: class IV adenylate cyclase, partial [Acidobacteria bacterium]|nr:class IV adenylate cyclase [Acidobacteriota bacterium]
FESNIVYDTPTGSLRSRGVVLRLRTVRGGTTLTFKGPAADARYKSRQETETSVAGAEAVRHILEGLGYRPAFRYEKYRAEWGEPGHAGTISVDETPIGTFLELEGAPEWIDAAARRLGFSESDYITATYGRLYFDHCRERAVTAYDMVFESSA